MGQLLLFPDPRPLVQTLGAAFFREAPQCPGVYLMYDRAATLLYVGKAKNLRKRLASYRVANPERMPHRHLKLLRTVQRIEVRECEDEADALTTEAELLRRLRPKFNRAGTWVPIPRWLGWRRTVRAFELTIRDSTAAGWHTRGPVRIGGWHLRTAVARLLWLGLHPCGRLTELPHGWFRSRNTEKVLSVPLHGLADCEIEAAERSLNSLFGGVPQRFATWVLQQTTDRREPFDLGIRDADLETVLSSSGPRPGVLGSDHHPAPPGETTERIESNHFNPEKRL